MTNRRHPYIFLSVFFLACIASSAILIPFRAAEPLPSKLSDDAYWKMITDFSEEGGYFRRNHWVPLPEARDLDELNAYLERCCREDQRRVLTGRTETVGSAMLIGIIVSVALAPLANRARRRQRVA